MEGRMLGGKISADTTGQYRVGIFPPLSGVGDLHTQHDPACDLPAHALWSSHFQEWATRVSNMTLVHTGGGTNMAMYTHHTTTRPRFPPGSIRQGTYTLSQYLPQEDAAVRVRMMGGEQYLPVSQEDAVTRWLGGLDD